jgi:uncharacterized protein YbjT (DUF2867 family)
LGGITEIRGDIVYAVMGATGQVGAVVAKSLISASQQVRVIMRNPEKAAGWKVLDAEVALADYGNAEQLAAAFAGAEGVFIMIPPNAAPSPDYSESRAYIMAIRKALESSRPAKIVYLSSIGAQRKSGAGLISALHLLEEAIDVLPTRTAALRAAYFMENYADDVAKARKTGKLQSYLQPLEHKYPMVATYDVGRAGAKLLVKPWEGHRHLEISGPRKYSPLDVTEAFSSALKKKIEPLVVPRDAWIKSFVEKGIPANKTAGLVEMLEGFNSKWIDFGVAGAEALKGSVELETVIDNLVKTIGA